MADAKHRQNNYFMAYAKETFYTIGKEIILQHLQDTYFTAYAKKQFHGIGKRII